MNILKKIGLILSAIIAAYLFLRAALITWSGLVVVGFTDDVKIFSILVLLSIVLVAVSFIFKNRKLAWSLRVLSLLPLVLVNYFLV